MESLPLEITCCETETQLSTDSPPLLLDCRESEEYALVAIEGSQLLPMSEIASRVGEIAAHQQKPVVVYCHHGGRSAQVATWLRGQGFTQVQSMAGGIDAWATEIEPGMARY